jgi:hypothetical protein
MLRLVTDSHVPPAVAKAARKLTSLDITAPRDWHGGLHLHESDARLLALARDDGVTLFTHDENTFPLTVKERIEDGLSHADMIYVSARYRQNDIGRIARAVVKLSQTEKGFDWKNRIRFLD